MKFQWPVYIENMKMYYQLLNWSYWKLTLLIIFSGIGNLEKTEEYQCKKIGWFGKYIFFHSNFSNRCCGPAYGYAGRIYEASSIPESINTILQHVNDLLETDYNHIFTTVLLYKIIT